MMKKEQNALRELSFLEQFLAQIENIGEAISSVKPAYLRLKYRQLYSECRFAVNALKWRIEDDINRLGCEDLETVNQQGEDADDKKGVHFESSDELRLQEAAQVIDNIVKKFEKQLGESERITGWKFSYDRKKGPLELWPIYQED